MALKCIAGLVFLVFASSIAAGSSLSPLTATYLGADSSDEALGVDIAPDGTIVVVGKFPNWIPGTTVLSFGDPTSGRVIRLSSDGRSVLSVSSLGSVVSDIEITANGKLAVCGDFGIAFLNASGSNVLWSKPGNYTRIAVAADGLAIAAIRSDKTIEVYDSLGVLLGSRSNSDREVNDIAVDGKNRTVIITGFNNESTGRSCGSFSNCPVQVAFLRAYSYDCRTQKWKAYNWPGPWMDGNDPVHNQAGNIMADTRGYRVSMGRDGKLYYGGESAGGNMVYFYHPQNFGVSVHWPRYDNYSDAWNAGADHVTFVGKFDPSTGALLNGQLIFPRDPATSKTKTHRPRGISADEQGNVYVTGMTNCCIENRDSSRICGSKVTARIGTEMFAAIIDSSFTKRTLWVVFTDGPLTGGYPWGSGVAVRSGKVALSGVANCAQKICNALKSTPVPDAARTDGYLVVWNTSSGTHTTSPPNGSSLIPVSLTISDRNLVAIGSGSMTLAAYSVNGQLLLKRTGHNRISVSGLKSGTFVVRVHASGQWFQRMVMIK